MGLFNSLFSGADINAGVEEFKNTKGAKLIDVRTPEEYKMGHIENSINIPLDRVEMIQNKIKDVNTPLFVHCQSGARSAQAASYLQQLGYTNVKNIGGIGSLIFPVTTY